MFRKIALVFTDPTLRSKVFKIFGLLIVARLLTYVPIPEIGIQDLSNLLEDNVALSLLNMVSGGGYGSLSFVMLGIAPYITSSIIFQLLGVIVPKIAQIKKEEGEQGKQKINRWTRFLTVPLAALSAFGILKFLQAEGGLLPEVFSNPAGDQYLTVWVGSIIALTAGAIVMMWIGEIISEFKMGNGISLLILAGIISTLPGQLVSAYKASAPQFSTFFETISKNNFAGFLDWSNWQAFLYQSLEYKEARDFLFFFAIALLTLVLVVFMNEAVRKLVLIYSRRGHVEGSSRTLQNVKADLPIKVNVAGVIPVIFAISFVLFPSIIYNFVSTSNLTGLSDRVKVVADHISPDRTDAVKPLVLDDHGKLGFYLLDNSEKVEAVKGYDTTVSADYFRFTLDNTQNQIADWLPETAVHFAGISAYIVIYFLLVIFFTYFYTTNIAFKTDDVAENLQKTGAYIPGYRPGKETEEYLSYVSNRLNVVGSLFLALIAIFPILMSSGLSGSFGSLATVVGGTSVLIMVSVAMEALRQTNAQITSADYERFTK